MKENDFQFFASDEDEAKLLLECLLGQPGATKISRFLIKNITTIFLCFICSKCFKIL